MQSLILDCPLLDRMVGTTSILDTGHILSWGYEYGQQTWCRVSLWLQLQDSTRPRRRSSNSAGSRRAHPQERLSERALKRRRIERDKRSTVNPRSAATLPPFLDEAGGEFRIICMPGLKRTWRLWPSQHRPILSGSDSMSFSHLRPRKH